MVTWLETWTSISTSLAVALPRPEVATAIGALRRAYSGPRQNESVIWTLSVRETVLAPRQIFAAAQGHQLGEEHRIDC